MFDLAEGVTGAEYMKQEYVLERAARLQPWRRFTASYQEMEGEPLAEGKAAYESWLAWWFSGFTDSSGSIYPETYPDNTTWIGDLQIYSRKYLDRLIDMDSASFQVPVLAFSLPDEDAAWIYGFSFHDPELGRPATYSLTTAVERAIIGYGLTTTTVHEFGHNLGLDHPHDVPGQGGVPSGDDYYMWTGSESNSMMSYIDTNWDFGQFDQDNTARGMTALYLNEANLVLGELAGLRLSARARGLLAAADARATKAVSVYRLMEYRKAATEAAGAYALVLKVARSAGADVVRAVPAPAASDSPAVPRPMTDGIRSARGR
jgi:hypothetical protein